jgi:CheY-like chemotaxis protein/anti-sigma regulatory factor (Ser/Thr protein kinase)
VVESQRPAAASAGVALELSVPDAEQAVIGEASRLQQVVTNLLSNAIRFTPAGGRVDVTLTYVRDQAHLRVRDTGAGIAPDFLPLVFEQFRQADSTTTRRHGGLGLGLAIVHRLVELHGGRVRAESEGLGKGATFTVTLPLAAASAAALPLDAVQFPDFAGASILVVDDDEDGRGLVALLLERCGAEVRTAASVREARAEIGRRLPDLLLSDIAMPAEDGFELLAQLRADGHTLPAIAVSACVTPEDRQRALNAGFARHLPKPVDAVTLFAVIDSLLRGHGAERRLTAAKPIARI